MKSKPKQNNYKTGEKCNESRKKECVKINKICNEKTGRCNMKAKPKQNNYKTGEKCNETRKNECVKINKICNEKTGRCNMHRSGIKKTYKLKLGERCPAERKKQCNLKNKICDEVTGRCLRAEQIKSNEQMSSISPLHAVNIDEKDFYSNICVLLRNLAKYKQIYSETGGRHLWTDDALLDLDNLLPTLRNNKQMPNNKIILNLNKLKKSYIAYLGSKNIVVKEKIGGGSYGDIYSGYISGKPCAIKISKNESTSIKSRIEYHAENIIHSELFCNTDNKLPSICAQIPRPYFMCKYSKSKSAYSYMFGMEPLDGNLYHFITYYRKKLIKTIPKDKPKIIDEFTKEMLKMMRGICLLLEYLQKIYKFYHRDMHGGNMMYKKVLSGYEWYLIDFGMSTMVLNDNQLNMGSVGVYSPYSVGAKGKDGHDIRLMVLSIMDNHSVELETLLKPELFKELKDLNIAIQQQFDDNSLPIKKYEWHRGYRDAFRKVDTLVTQPKNFLEQIVEKYDKMYNF